MGLISKRKITKEEKRKLLIKLSNVHVSCVDLVLVYDIYCCSGLVF